MQKYVQNVVMAGIALVLVGCHSSPMQSLGNVFQPYSRGATQQTLGQSVQAALVQTNDPQLAQLRVDTRQNTVILSGYVKKIRQSDTAELISRQVPGVQAIENNIVVRP